MHDLQKTVCKLIALIEGAQILTDQLDGETLPSVVAIHDAALDSLVRLMGELEEQEDAGRERGLAGLRIAGEA